MTKQTAYDTLRADAQATAVEPVAPERFDYEAFEDRESACLERCRAFRAAQSGILVHRRMRVGEVFSHLCRDMQSSLRLQLGGLQAGLEYENDCANFLEPWYGIGTIAGAFGAEYYWPEGQAPMVRPLFSCAREALSAPVRPVRDTPIGRHTLEMMRYFLDCTAGRLPISLTDTQSPFNTACQIVDINGLLLEMLDDPEPVRQLLLLIAELLAEFTREQLALLGRTAVFPGHGFASSRVFGGVGFSDDNLLMISETMYRRVNLPSVERLAGAWGGIAFHSCGDWSRKLRLVASFPGLVGVDGAFTAETDPCPNPTAPFAEVLPESGLVLNARLVGGAESATAAAAALWRPGLKLIAVTYCPSPREQAFAYERIHGLARIGS